MFLRLMCWYHRLLKIRTADSDARVSKVGSQDSQAGIERDLTNALTLTVFCCLLKFYHMICDFQVSQVFYHYLLDIHQILMCNQAKGKENKTLSFNLISMHEISTLVKGKCNNFLTKEK